MTIYNTTQARAKLFQIIDEANATDEPIYIKGKRNNAVVISEAVYAGMQETMYINSVLGWADRIIEASNSPLEECVSHEEAWK